MKQEPIIQSVMADWKDPEGLLDSVNTALRAFGLRLVNNPALDGSDQIGGFIVNQAVTDKDIEEYNQD